MKKSITRRLRILKLLYVEPTQTCAELCTKLIKVERIPANSTVRRYLSGAVSSLLLRMQKDDQIYSIGHAGPRGGKCYCLSYPQFLKMEKRKNGKENNH